MNKKGSAKASLSRSFLPRGKKGMAAKTLGELIIALAMGLIILLFLTSIIGFLSPAIGGFGCGLNVRVYSATVSATLGWLGAPIVMCNQYNSPEEINAANYKACPGLADFCDNAKGTIRDECYRQCARIQINSLADSCWAMGGKGEKDLKGPWWDDLGDKFMDLSSQVAGNFAAAVFVFPVAIIHPALALNGPVLDAAGKVRQEVIAATTPTRNIILKCYRFQIINPARTSDGKPFILSDDSLGLSQNLSLSQSDCGTLKQKYPCYLGGQGVEAATFNPKTNRTAMSINDLWKLNYNETSPRQVCYLSFHQYKDKNGDMHHTLIRSCDGWSPYGGTIKNLN